MGGPSERASGGRLTRRALIAVLALILLNPSAALADDPPPEDPPTTGSLAGVIDAAGEGPLEGVTVDLSGAAAATTSTDGAGAYSFTDLAPGDYAIDASACGFVAGQGAATVVAGEEAVLNLTLNREIVTIQGFVTDDAASPLDATVDASDPYTGEPTTTDAEGHYSLSVGSCRSYTLTVTVSGEPYQYEPVDRIVNPGSEGATEDFVLPATTGAIAGTITEADTAVPVPGATVTISDASTNEVETTSATGAYRSELAPGSYDVAIDACGFLPASVEDVDVVAGSDAAVDVTLTRPWVTVSGSVTDGSGGGWPLYARVQIAGPQNLSVFTDPATGTYSVELNPCRPYTLTITAESGGYVPSTIPLTPGDAGDVIDASLIVKQSPCTAPGYHVVTRKNETFSTGGHPAGWSVVTPINNGRTWRFDNVGNRRYGTEFFMHEHFAMVDADYYFQAHGGRADTDTSLISPPVDVRGLRKIVLEFDSDNYAYNSFAYVDLSVDNGANWDRLASLPAHQALDRAPRHFTFDITERALGKSQVKVRFQYVGLYYSKWWAIDNVRIGTPGCIANTDGIAYGSVQDEAASPLVGAKIDEPGGAQATTFATPADPAQPDGFYVIASEAGSRALVARAAGLGSNRHLVSITPSGATRQDFVLPPHYQVGPAWAASSTQTGQTRDKAGFDYAATSATGSAATGSFDVTAAVEEYLPTYISGSGYGSVSAYAITRLSHSIDITGNAPRATASFEIDGGSARRKTYGEANGALAQSASASVSISVRFIYQSCAGGTCTATNAPGSQVVRSMTACAAGYCPLGPTSLTADLVGESGPGRVVVEVTVSAAASANGHADADARAWGRWTSIDVA